MFPYTFRFIPSWRLTPELQGGEMYSHLRYKRRLPNSHAVRHSEHAIMISSTQTENSRN
jgi:hypothetical protein